MRGGRIPSTGSTGSGDLQLSRLLADFSFLRISIDHVTMDGENGYLRGLQERGAIYGYTLKYSFPCPDGVSSSLRAKVLLRASSFSSNAIFFRHKRVNLVKLNADVIPFWSRSVLVMELEVQLNVRGKYSTRPLARCTVPLEDLLLPPFAISRDYEFRGERYEGAALIKIDLGSQQRPLMERLERWRGEVEGVGGSAPLGAAGSDSSFTIPAGRHTRSRSGSRCRSRCSEGNGNGAENEEEDDDDVFYDGDSGRGGRAVAPLRVRNQSMPSLNGIGGGGRERRREEEERVCYARPVVTTRRSSASSLTRADSASGSMKGGGRQAVRIRLVIHGGRGLPMVKDRRGLLIPPSALISVRGRDGELRSPVQERGRSPLFNWSCTFDVSGERRNVVVKILHRDEEGNDVPLGFVSLPLPTATVHEADYELVELGAAAAAAAASMITLSVDASASSRPPSTLDGSAFGAPVPVAPGPKQAPPGGLDAPPPFSMYASSPLGGGGARTNSRLSAASSMTIGGTAPSGGYEAPPLRLSSRRRSPSPEILIMESKEEIENRLRRNMTELDILVRRLDRR